MFCPVDGTGRRPVAGRRRSLPGRASEPARAKESHGTLSCTIGDIIPSCHTFPALRVAFCGPVGSARTPTLAHFRRCPPGCAHASGLLLAPPRAMLCEPALCGSMIASSPPNRCYAHLLGTVAVAMSESSGSSSQGHVASPPQAHEAARWAPRIFRGIPPLCDSPLFAPRLPAGVLA